MVPRILHLPFGRKSFFLFGPRQVGKSTLVKHALANRDHVEIDLLKSDVMLRYKTNPSLLRSEIEYLAQKKEKNIVFIDEIQKVPDLLNEIHYLIERFNDKVTFVLTGSSARKLKRSSVNMLAGRAWQFALFPFTHKELGDSFRLDEVLLKGSLPPVVQEVVADAFMTLDAYSRTYLKEEIMDEALVRNIGAFSKFLDLAADQSGKIVNFSTIGRETGVSSKTIKGYYEILEDTLVAIRLEPYLRSARKRLVRHPKYYLFDLGVINSLCGRTTPRAAGRPTVRGILFEHFIILELYRLLHYNFRPVRMFHWRSSHGAEVDLVLEDGEVLWAIEIKSTETVSSKDLRGLGCFMEDHPQARPICVSTTPRPFMAGNIPVIPWEELFSAEYLSL